MKTFTLSYKFYNMAPFFITVRARNKKDATKKAQRKIIAEIMRTMFTVHKETK